MPNVNNITPKPTTSAEYMARPTRTTKDTDIVIFDKVGASRVNPGKDGGRFRATGEANWLAKIRNAFKPKADGQDIYDIFRNHGMSKKDAAVALAHVKVASDKLGLSGFSAKAVEDQLRAANKL